MKANSIIVARARVLNSIKMVIYWECSIELTCHFHQNSLYALAIAMMCALHLGQSISHPNFGWDYLFLM